MAFKFYAYDGLHRLASRDRGWAKGGNAAWTVVATLVAAVAATLGGCGADRPTPVADTQEVFDLGAPLEPDSALPVATAATGAVSPALTFEQERLECVARLGESRVQAAFSFTNNGTTPVRITQIHTFCGCTATEYDEGPFAPGERGTIEVLFDVEDRRGEQRKNIQVHTDDPARPVIVLQLVVQIPEPFTPSASVVSWSQEEAEKSKSVTVDLAEGLVADTFAVESENPALAVSLELLDEAPRRYRLNMTPTGKPAAQEFRVHLAAADVSGKKYVSQLLVRPLAGEVAAASGAMSPGG